MLKILSLSLYTQKRIIFLSHNKYKFKYTYELPRIKSVKWMMFKPINTSNLIRPIKTG
jgi:hypothetical protein